MTKKPTAPTKAEASPGTRSGQGAESILEHMKRDSRQRASENPAELLVARRSKHTVLVVDDVDAARYALVRIVQAAGYRTLDAAGGAEALSQAAQASCVLLDVHLPDILGTEVCRLLRGNPATSTLPIVHVSAVYVAESDRNNGLQAGADAYFVAPVDPPELLATIDRLLAL